MIRPLAPQRLPDLATLFEQGGDPKWCWCTWFRFRGRDFTNSIGAQDRADFEATAADLAPERALGLLAYRGDVGVDWTSLCMQEFSDEHAGFAVVTWRQSNAGRRRDRSSVSPSDSGIGRLYVIRRADGIVIRHDVGKHPILWPGSGWREPGAGAERGEGALGRPGRRPTAVAGPVHGDLAAGSSPDLIVVDSVVRRG